VDTSYRLLDKDNLLVLEVKGRLTISEVWRLNGVFRRAITSNYDRFLIDYRGLTDVVMSVDEFTAAGISERLNAEPLAESIRVAYLSSNQVVFGFCRIVQNVWSSHMNIEVYTDEAETLAWLGLDCSIWSELTCLSTG
jgi:hypothetical protein